MALSKKSLNILIDALSSKDAANELVKIVGARAGKPSRILTQSVVDAMAGRVTGNEVLAALVSGANLSLAARRKVLIMMSDKTSGNELINFIQSVPQSKNTTL